MAIRTDSERKDLLQPADASASLSADNERGATAGIVSAGDTYRTRLFTAPGIGAGEAGRRGRA